jgi:hypothetical protein
MKYMSPLLHSSVVFMYFRSIAPSVNAPNGSTILHVKSRGSVWRVVIFVVFQNMRVIAFHKRSFSKTLYTHAATSLHTSLNIWLRNLPMPSIDSKKSGQDSWAFLVNILPEPPHSMYEPNITVAWTLLTSLTSELRITASLCLLATSSSCCNRCSGTISFSTTAIVLPSSFTISDLPETTSEREWK